MSSLNRVIFIIIAVAMAGVVACDINRHAGHNGQLMFEYYSTMDRFNFNKPVIEGGNLAVFTYDIPEHQPADIVEARSTTPEVARIDDIDGNLFVVHGLSTGRAKFEVRARTEGGELRIDTVALRVDEATSVHFEPELATASRGKILRHNPVDGPDPTLEVTADSRIEIPWARISSGGEALVGYGAYPIAIEPPDDASIYDTDDDESITLSMPDDERTFAVVPAEDYEGDEMTIEVVDPGPFDAAYPPPTLVVDTLLDTAGIDRLRFAGHHRQLVNGLPRLALMWFVVALIAILILWTTHSLRSR